MLLTKFEQFITWLTVALDLYLPSDIVFWLGGLVVVIFVLAVWRMVH